MAGVAVECNNATEKPSAVPATGGKAAAAPNNKATPSSSDTVGNSTTNKRPTSTPAPGPNKPTPSSRGTTGSKSTDNKRPGPTPPGSAGGGANKKRPYRRTKRPKNYCDKSTVTTTTPTAQTPVNVYDAVLGECEDLLRASLEAHRLGRLKMASAYQLLLHTRLVGLGKRFDRTTILPPNNPNKRRKNDDEYDEDDEEEEESGDETETESEPSPSGAVIDPNAPTSAHAASIPPHPAGSQDELPSGDTRTTEPNFPPALQQLTSILPSNLEMDTTMMEHLARAAVELHHQRTGRKKSADGLLASPMTGLIGNPSPTAVTNNSSSFSKGKKSDTSKKVAWTPEEQKIVEQSIKEKKAPYAIAKLLQNKTEAQVKAFLKNRQKTKQAGGALLHDDHDDDDDDGDEPLTPSKKRGGRGRKPPTTAMNTVPNANLDAKSLLQGNVLRK